MSSKNSKKKSSTSAASNSNTPLRIMIKCGWSGKRVPLPPDQKITVNTTLTEIITLAKNQLPTSVFEQGQGECTLLHMRSSIQQSLWPQTKLGDVGVESNMGSALLTLHLPGQGGNGGGGAWSPPVGEKMSSSPSQQVQQPEPMDVDDDDDVKKDNGTTEKQSTTHSSYKTATTDASSATPPDAPSSGGAFSSLTPSPAAGAANTSTATPTSHHQKQQNSNNNTPEGAINVILSSNFDVESKECIVTLIKILDNIISKPDDVKVRSIRLANPAFDKKVRQKKGGVNFLLACGFTAKPVEQPLLSLATTQPPSPEIIELLPERESTSGLLSARRLLATKAVSDLGMDMTELPKEKEPPKLTSPSDHAAGTRNNAGEFNPYKTHSYNTQSAAVGAANPHSVTLGDEGYVSKTEKELDNLKSKQQRLEKKMQKLEDRGLIATKPAPVGSIVTIRTGDDAFETGGGRGDGSLLAARMKKMEEERKKREEGGFTTKAMRDLEKLKKAKVYSHTQLRINFSDGSSLIAKFLPSERILEVKSVIRSAFVIELASGLHFDLYVAPPRRILEDKKSLNDEGLVPAAKIHVSWKVGGTPPQGCPVGGFIRSELFKVDSDTSSAVPVEFPEARSVAEEGTSLASMKRAASTGGNDDDVSSKEEEMMRRMLGKSPKGLLGKIEKGSSKDNSSTKKTGGGKPKWFK